MISNDKVSGFSFFFIQGKTFSFQTHLTFALSSRLYLHLHLSVKGIYNNVSPQNSRVQIDIQIGIEVITFPFKYRIILYDKRYIEIAARSAIDPFPAMTFQLDYLSVFHTCRYGNPQRLTVDSKSLLMRNRRLPQCQRQFGLNILPPVLSASESGRSPPLSEKFLEKV